FAQMATKVTALDISAGGIQLTGDLDVTSRLPPSACLKNPSIPEPGPAIGALPDLFSPPDADVGMAVNMGLMDDVLYHVWHEGFFCVTSETLKTQFGLDLSALDTLGALLPGFPKGTKFGLELQLQAPPTTFAYGAANAQIGLRALGVTAELIAQLPDNTFRHL